MSYLSAPRLHFSGFFQADVSTVNNDVRHFDSARFQSSYQSPQTSPQNMNGWWNPEGTGAFRLVGCKITGGIYEGQVLKTADDDPAIGLNLAGADGRVCGKLVDLDPQQQAVSEIWGLQVRLASDSGQALFSSDYRVAAFMDLWRRLQGSTQGDLALASYYQSVLENVVWNGTGGSKLLDAMRAASDDGLLSIKFNVFGFKMDTTSPEFTLGNLVGTIGPADSNEPATFVLGRHMMATLASPVAPPQNIYNFACEVHEKTQIVTADFGNALPISDGDGNLKNVGNLELGVLKNAQIDNGEVIAADAFESLGAVPYLEDGWYPSSAGLVDFSYSNSAWIGSHIADQPLALLKSGADGSYEVLIRESIDGLYVRTDNFVQRLDPGTPVSADFRATRYGRPHPAKINLEINNAMIGGGAGPTPLDPPVPVPNIGVPTVGISYPSSIETDADGRARVTITANAGGPGYPRRYIDGQVYGIGFALADAPANYHSNPWLFISLLAWDVFVEPPRPTWYRDIQPILQQYGNLYPIMSRHLVDLGDYESVARHGKLLELAFSLPVSDPNYMPVTRDLSTAKRNTILKWLRTNGPDGLPVKGSSVQRPPAEAVAPPAVEAAAADPSAGEGGKTAFLRGLGMMPSK